MGDFSLHLGDCLDVLATLPEGSVDTIITDPPYGLTFMGKDWDRGVPGVAFWQAALRVAKPGAMLLAFGGTRTHHRLMCAIEDAGWEIRDCLMWLYGSGFPKSHDISKGIDRAAGAEREVIGQGSSGITTGSDKRNFEQGKRARLYDAQTTFDITAPATDAARAFNGWGTALKPAWEPIIVAMKPLDGTFAQNAIRYGVAGLNVDGGRVGMGRFPANLILDEDAAGMLDEQSGVSRSVASSNRNGNNVQGVTGMVAPRSIDMVRGHNDSGGASRFFYVAKASRSERERGLDGMPRVRNDFQRETSGLNQDRPNREGRNPAVPSMNHHPTVKPLALMRYLCTLTATPTGGMVLDPFMGSGTTGIAAIQTGRRFIGVEIDPDYLKIAERRIESARVQLPLFEAAA
jgi:DNA modification methylase